MSRVSWCYWFLPHKFTAWAFTGFPGRQRRTCTRCGRIETRELVTA